jgi:hypothetical protein
VAATDILGKMQSTPDKTFYVVGATSAKFGLHGGQHEIQYKE